MMGRIDNQMQLLILDLDSMIPENHLLRQIKNSVNFDFIYEKASSFYSHTGRKSIDPVVMIKMLLIGYLYGIKSERRLEEEVSLNLAYRAYGHFPRPSGPRSPARQGHIKRPVLRLAEPSFLRPANQCC